MLSGLQEHFPVRNHTEEVVDKLQHELLPNRLCLVDHHVEEDAPVFIDQYVNHLVECRIREQPFGSYVEVPNIWSDFELSHDHVCLSVSLLGATSYIKGRLDSSCTVLK